MPRIAADSKYTIYVHVRGEHPPPHVHVYYDGRVSRVSLFDLRVMDAVPKREARALVAVVSRHRAHALAIWVEVNEQRGR
jgi:hypothetical protein